jgi:hypothetical protein
MKSTLIIGSGQIGTSMYNVLSKVISPIFIRDIEPIENVSDVLILHICFPYSNKFVEQVLEYQKQYQPKYTVIHSTVSVGTSEKCNAFYSPVRGIHPHLEKSLTTFVKYLAPKNRELKRYFESAGIQIKAHKSRETLEAMKLYCTTIYGLNIIVQKEMKRFCDDNGLDFDTVYTDCNLTYNDGYKKLGFPQYSKYVLEHRDGKIGGHCVIPNCDLLQTDVAKFIKEQNEKY